MVEEMEGSQGEDQLEDQEEREKTQYGKIWLTWVLRREWHWPRQDGDRSLQVQPKIWETTDYKRIVDDDDSLLLCFPPMPNVD